MPRGLGVYEQVPTSNVQRDLMTAQLDYVCFVCRITSFTLLNRTLCLMCLEWCNTRSGTPATYLLFGTSLPLE